MAYNRRNILLKIIDIQEIYKEHSKNFNGGCSDKWIWENKIFPVYRISLSRFYDYLKTPAKMELRHLENNNKKQLSFF